MKKGKIIPIIIVTYNQLHKFTIPCINSILKNTHGPDIHIIVVDNGSSDNTVKELEERYVSDPVTVLDIGSNLGWDGGNIKGIEYIDSHIDYEMFVLINSDTIVSPGWLERMVGILTEYPNAVSVIPVERIQHKNIIKKVYNKISDYVLVKFVVNYSPLRFLKSKGMAQTKEDKPDLNSRGIASFDDVAALNMRLMKKHGNTFENLPSIGTGYCVLLKRAFKSNILLFLENFEENFGNEKYWIAIKEKHNVEYLRAKGVYVYHFRGGSGGYFVRQP